MTEFGSGQEIAKAQSQEIVQSMNPYEGMEGNSPDFLIIKHDWNGRIFLLGQNDRLSEMNAMILLYRGGIRRNYETEYDPRNIEAPSCYSVDGVEGSRSQEQKVFPFLKTDKKNEANSPVNIYGICASCHFSQFGTGGIWKGLNPRKGQQCSQYGLAFLLLDSGVPVVLQVPPTSSKEIPNALNRAIVSRPGTSIRGSWWNLAPCGAGKDNNSIKISLTKGATSEEVRAADEIRNGMQGFIEQFILRFAQGGGESTVQEMIAAKNDFGGNDII